jgi:hypothetical protein
MKTKKQEVWYGQFGVLRAYNGNQDQMNEFQEIVRLVKEAVKPLEGRVSYRDLYDIAKDAAVTAVGELVCAYVNGQQALRRAKRKKRKS